MPITLPPKARRLIDITVAHLVQRNVTLAPGVEVELYPNEWLTIVHVEFALVETRVWVLDRPDPPPPPPPPNKP